MGPIQGKYHKITSHTPPEMGFLAICCVDIVPHSSTSGTICQNVGTLARRRRVCDPSNQQCIAQVTKLLVEGFSNYS